MITIYRVCQEIVELVLSFGKIAVNIFFTPLDEFIIKLPEEVQTVLIPIDWVLDLLSIGDASLITIMFTAGVNIWIIMGLKKLFT